MRQTSYIIWENHEKALPITWGTDWDNIRHTWLLSHKKTTLTPVIYGLTTL